MSLHKDNSAYTGAATPAEATRATGKPHSISQSNTHLQLREIKNEPRVDSRLLAGQLENQHGKMMANIILKYQEDFEELGILSFEKGEIKGRGQPEKIALLNEDQAYLLLTYSRNSLRVRRLKINLVRAFSRFRDAQQSRRDCLPFNHTLLDVTVDHQNIFLCNINRLISNAFDVDLSSRSNLSSSMRLKIAHAQMLAADTAERCLRDGLDYQATNQRIKNLVFGLAEAGMIDAQGSDANG